MLEYPEHVLTVRDIEHSLTPHYDIPDSPMTCTYLGPRFIGSLPYIGDRFQTPYEWLQVTKNARTITRLLTDAGYVVEPW